MVRCPKVLANSSAPAQVHHRRCRCNGDEDAFDLPVNVMDLLDAARLASASMLASPCAKTGTGASGRNTSLR